MENFEYELNIDFKRKDLIMNALFELRSAWHENALEALNNDIYDSIMVTILNKALD
jgi:hypothetical protein